MGHDAPGLFEQFNRPALLPLPSAVYEYTDWKRCRKEPAKIPSAKLMESWWRGASTTTARSSSTSTRCRSSCCAGSRGEDHREDRGNLPPRQAGGRAPAQPAAASANDGGRPHAKLASTLPRLDARADPARGRHGRPAGRPCWPTRASSWCQTSMGALAARTASGSTAVTRAVNPARKTLAPRGPPWDGAGAWTRGRGGAGAAACQCCARAG